MTTQARSLAEPCPKCGASPGSLCNGTKGPRKRCCRLPDQSGEAEGYANGQVQETLFRPEYYPIDPPNPSIGRLANAVRPQEVQWIADGLIPRDALTLVAGAPSVGKSTFGAWLCSRVVRPAILPGSEESIGAALLPRLLTSRVPLDRCLLLDGRRWTLPFDQGRIVAALQSHRADLLWIDPIDHLIGDLSENDGQAVRHCLESLHAIAEQCGLAVVAARHPGKATDNICPGSRQWRAVPRVILRLDLDRGPPLRRFLSVMKPYGGTHPRPREYTLIGEPGEPARFSLGPEVSEAEAALGEVTDRHDRWRIDEAERLLTGLLAEGEQPSQAVYAAAESERISDRCIFRAGQRLGVIIRRDGVGREHRSYWSLTPATHTHTPTPATPATHTHTPGGGCVSDGGSGRSAPPPPKKARKRRGTTTN